MRRSPPLIAEFSGLGSRGVQQAGGTGSRLAIGGDTDQLKCVVPYRGAIKRLGQDVCSLKVGVNVD